MRLIKHFLIGLSTLAACLIAATATAADGFGMKDQSHIRAKNEKDDIKNAVGKIVQRRKKRRELIAETKESVTQNAVTETQEN